MDDELQRVHQVMGDDNDEKAPGDDERGREDESKESRHQDASGALCAVTERERHRREGSEQPRREAESHRERTDEHPAKEEFLEAGNHRQDEEQQDGPAGEGVGGQRLAESLVGTDAQDRVAAEETGWEFLPVEQAADAAEWALGGEEPEDDPFEGDSRDDWP